MYSSVFTFCVDEKHPYLDIDVYLYFIATIIQNTVFCFQARSCESHIEHDRSFRQGLIFSQLQFLRVQPLLLVSDLSYSHASFSAMRSRGLPRSKTGSYDERMH